MIEKTSWIEEDYLTQELINFANGNGINEDKYYIFTYASDSTVNFYYKTNDNGIELQKVNVEDATIYVTDDFTPCIKWYRCYRSFWWKSEESYYCKIYVPEGTVSTKFIIDME